MENWITQLTSDDWKERQQAMEKLVALGDDAVPRLSKLADAADDGEVRTRAAAAIRQIEENRIAGTSLITMKVDDVPPAQALAEITRQARASLMTEPANLLSQKNLRPVSLNVDHRPFWEVMQTLCAQAELEVTGVSRHGREVGLGLTRGGTDWMDKPIVLAGPLLIRADRLIRISTAHLKPPRDVTEEFTISLTAFAEPKLRVLDYSATLRLEEVVDEKGNSLIPPTDNNVPANVDVFGNIREGTTSHWEIGATLHHPKGAGKRIVRFKGSTALQVQTRAAVMELPVAGAKNVSRTVGGLRLTVKSLDTARCDMVVYRDGRSDAEWYGVRMQLYAGEAQLFDDKGQLVARSQSGLEADESPDSQRLDLRLRFARESGDEGKEARKKPISEASRLVWTFPLETRELVIPFELRDLPIP
ncbi:MAG: hypothetical protein JWN40_5361 [Phycisphaerales bacterium]|nr:hypothetical protein [Phycisphaerales bacterium]